MAGARDSQKGMCPAGKWWTGLESNWKNNPLISIPFLEQTQVFPHTLPHIFIHLTVVRFSVLIEKLNKLAVRGAPECSIMALPRTVHLRVRDLVQAINCSSRSTALTIEQMAQ